MADRWDETRSRLLAAASAASSAATSLVEFSRQATGGGFTRPNVIETLTELNDALRLTIEAGSDPADDMLLATLEKWSVDNG